VVLNDEAIFARIASHRALAMTVENALAMTGVNALAMTG